MQAFIALAVLQLLLGLVTASDRNVQAAYLFSLIPGRPQPTKRIAPATDIT
jgi:hypothetical protein